MNKAEILAVFNEVIDKLSKALETVHNPMLFVQTQAKLEAYRDSQQLIANQLVEAQPTPVEVPKTKAPKVEK